MLKKMTDLLTKNLAIFCRYVNESPMIANSAFVGLAAPGNVGSWQLENKVSFCKLLSLFWAIFANCYLF